MIGKRRGAATGVIEGVEGSEMVGSVAAVSSASPKAAAVANRSAGTMARARWIAWSTPSGTSGRTARTLGAGSAEPLGDDRLRGRAR